MFVEKKYDSAPRTREQILLHVIICRDLREAKDTELSSGLDIHWLWRLQWLLLLRLCLGLFNGYWCGHGPAQHTAAAAAAETCAAFLGIIFLGMVCCRVIVVVVISDISKDTIEHFRHGTKKEGKERRNVFVARTNLCPPLVNCFDLKQLRQI